MAEYYDESRNEGPNILGMAGLLGLGALAGAGGYYALRNTRGKNAAAEALTRSARSERPRGVQMTDLGARRTGDFGLVDIPPSRSTRITGDRGVISTQGLLLPMHRSNTPMCHRAYRRLHLLLNCVPRCTPM
jgi:hypothetical protein